MNSATTLKVHRPEARPELSARDHGADAVKVQLAHVFQQRLQGQESVLPWDLAKYVDAEKVISGMLYAYPSIHRPGLAGYVGCRRRGQEDRQVTGLLETAHPAQGNLC